MKKAMRGTVVLLMLCITASVFAGGQQGGSPQGGGTTPSGKVYISWLYFGSPEEQQQWNATTQAFNAKQDKIEVEYIPCANDAYTQKLLSMFASNEAPDCFYARNAETPVLLREGKLLDLTPLLNAEPSFNFERDYVNWQQINKPYLANGKIYAVTDNDNPMVLYYNKDILSRLGLEDPHALYKADKWTWDVFESYCKTINAVSKPDAPVYAYIVDSWVDTMMHLAGGSNGMEAFWINGKPQYNDPKFVEALEYLVRNIKDETFLYGGSTGSGLSSSQLFNAGQIAFTQAGRWVVPTYRVNKDLHFNVVPWPKGPRATKYIAYTPGYTAYAISADTKHPKEAWEWLKYFTGPEGQMQNYGKGGNCMVTIKSMIRESMAIDYPVYDNPDVFIDIQQVALWPDVEYCMNSRLSSHVEITLDSVFMLETTPRAAMDQLMKDIASESY
jgi:multiple sugar transport system substrate-binding protein